MSAWGVLGVIPSIAFALIVAVLAAVLAAYFWLAAENVRREDGYVICEADYSDAPRQIKSAMRRIYRSARSVQDGRAHRTGMFGDLSLDELVYAAAEQAVLSSHVAAGARDLKPDATAADRELLAAADAQIEAIVQQLQEVETALDRSVTSAVRLSRQLEEPEKRLAEEKLAASARAAAEERRERARERLQKATSEAQTSVGVDGTDVEDKIAGISAGYAEATGISERALGNSGDDSGDRRRQAAVNVAKSSAAQAAKLSAAAARVGVKKMKSQRRDR